MECEYCGKVLATKGSLTRHQKTIKYCLELQSKKSLTFKCDSCHKILSNKYNLTVHQKSCKQIKRDILDDNRDREIESLKDKVLERDQTIQKLEKQLENLQDKLLKIATKSKTTNISILQQNFTAITDERLAEDAKKITLDHIAGGGERIASVFLDGSLKDNAVCTDVARRIIHHKDENGNLIKDVNALIITKRAFSSLMTLAKEIKNKFGEDIDTDDDDQIERLGKVMCVVGEMGQTIAGQTTETSTDFAKAVCHGSVN
jgi:predicted RNase H-like nuclease (RuvC/YqgF family)